MKQIFAKHFYEANYASADGWVPLVGGEGSFSTDPFAATQSRHPWSCAGTLRHLAVQVPAALGHAPTFTVLLNGVATVLAVTLAVGETYVLDDVHNLDVLPGDDLALALTGASIPFPGFGGGYSIEFEGLTANESGYGLAPFGGSINLASPTTVGRHGGALGNGVFSICDAAPSVLSNTYSIVPADGTVTRFDVQTHSGAPGTGVWTANLVLNTVIQDGTGGTVNTTVVLTGATTAAFTTFALPVVPTDHLEALVVRTGADAAFALAHVGTSIAFVSTDADVCVLVGGNNNATTTAFTDYQWVGAEQQRTTNAEAAAPVGPTGFVAAGLYVERFATLPAPGLGKAWVHTLRKSDTDTATVVTIADLADTGLFLGDVAYLDGDTINLSIVPVNAPSLSKPHWGLAVSTADLPPPPPPTGHVYPTRRLRQWLLPASPEGRWRFLRRLEIVLDGGIGLTAGPPTAPVQGALPYVMLQVSRDGGQTWGPERWVTAGALGEYDRRAVLANCGRYRDGAVRLVVSDPVAWRLLGADGVLEEGTS